MTHYYNIPKKERKPSTCICGAKFIKEGLKPWYPYHDAACKIKHTGGKVESEDLSKVPLPQLKQIAKGVFDAFIRQRDKNEVDITDLKPFKKGDKINASHLFPCNQYPGLIFNEDNCHSSKEENNFLMDVSETWEMTRINIITRIGQDRYTDLYELSKSQLIRNYKWSRVELIEKIELYTNKSKEK